MILHQIPFDPGPLDTMTARLCRTMDAMDRQWSARIKPAPAEKIETLSSDLTRRGWTIPAAYRYFLKAMGQDDGGLLEQEWDGGTEASIDRILEEYPDYFDEPCWQSHLLFSTHWTESNLFLPLTGAENPPVDHYAGRFADSFENYLFQMAFRRAEDTQFLYQTCCSTSKEDFQDILSRYSALSYRSPMDLMEQLLAPWGLQRAWFSDSVRLCGVAPEYLISVDLSWALNIKLSSDSHTVLQQKRADLTRLFGDLIHW